MQTLIHYVNGYNDPGFWIVDICNGEVTKSKFVKLSRLSSYSIARMFKMGAYGAGTLIERKRL